MISSRCLTGDDFYPEEKTLVLFFRLAKNEDTLAVPANSFEMHRVFVNSVAVGLVNQATGVVIPC